MTPLPPQPPQSTGGLYSPTVLTVSITHENSLRFSLLQAAVAGYRCTPTGREGGKEEGRGPEASAHRLAALAGIYFEGEKKHDLSRVNFKEEEVVFFLNYYVIVGQILYPGLQRQRQQGEWKVESREGKPACREGTVMGPISSHVSFSAVS